MPVNAIVVELLMGVNNNSLDQTQGLLNRREFMPDTVNMVYGFVLLPTLVQETSFCSEWLLIQL